MTFSDYDRSDVVTVILAAGRGTRLAPIFPEYMKPVLPIKGIPLVRRLASLGLVYSARTIVVASPKNAEMLSDVLPDSVELVIQRKANGPGNALLAALRLSISQSKVLVLLGDNVVEVDDIFIPNTDQPVITTKRVAPTHAMLFTAWNHTAQLWTERETITEHYIHPARTEDEQGYVDVWCGPLVLDLDRTRTVLEWNRGVNEHNQQHELLIGPYMDRLAPEAFHHERNVIDIGTHYDWMKVSNANGTSDW